MSTTSLIRDFAKLLPTGYLFTARDLADVAPRAQIDTALGRLTKTSIIRRISHGVYMVGDESVVAPNHYEISLAKLASSLSQLLFMDAYLRKRPRSSGANLIRCRVSRLMRQLRETGPVPTVCCSQHEDLLCLTDPE